MEVLIGEVPETIGQGCQDQVLAVDLLGNRFVLTVLEEDAYVECNNVVNRKRGQENFVGKFHTKFKKL